MEQGRPVDPLPRDCVDAAIRWAIRLNYNVASTQEREAFERWRQRDPRHEIAWQRINGLNRFESDLDGLSPRLAGDALGAAADLRAQRRLRGRRPILKALPWIATAVGTGCLVHQHAPWQRLWADASTGVGEQRSLSLADGTVVMLNTDSAIGINLSGSARRLRLTRGEILVVTGTDADSAARLGHRRPFHVDTGSGQVHALGTRFTIRLQGPRVLVGVQHGAVRLDPAGGGPAAILREGETGWLARGGAQAAESQGYGSDDWTDGVLSARRVRLTHLLAELERYRPGRVFCEPDVADRRVSGLFHLRDTDRTLAFLAQTQALRVRYRTRFWVTVGALEGPAKKI